MVTVAVPEKSATDVNTNEVNAALMLASVPWNTICVLLVQRRRAAATAVGRNLSTRFRQTDCGLAASMSLAPPARLRSPSSFPVPASTSETTIELAPLNVNVCPSSAVLPPGDGALTVITGASFTGLTTDRDRIGVGQRSAWPRVPQIVGGDHERIGTVRRQTVEVRAGQVLQAVKRGIDGRDRALHRHGWVLRAIAGQERQAGGGA